MTDHSRWLRRLALIGFPLLALFSCAIGTRHRDVSGEPPHAALIGRECRVQVPLRAHGVAAELGRDQKTSYVTVWNPGFTGPELNFAETLPAGTSLRVLSARVCSNCPFDELLEYGVLPQPMPTRMAGLPVWLRGTMLAEGQVDCSGAAPIR